MPSIFLNKKYEKFEKTKLIFLKNFGLGLGPEVLAPSMLIQIHTRILNLNNFDELHMPCRNSDAIDAQN